MCCLVCQLVVYNAVLPVRCLKAVSLGSCFACCHLQAEEEVKPAESDNRDEDVPLGLPAVAVSSAAGEDGRRKVEEPCEMRRMSGEQSPFTPHGTASATVFFAMPEPQAPIVEVSAFYLS